MAGNVCDCGWIATAGGAGDGTSEDTPPLVTDVLTRILADWGSVAVNRWPDHMPAAPADAAHWWTTVQQPAHRHERVEPKRRGGWSTPYHDRLAFTLRSFLRAPTEMQRLVVAARKDGIWWQGESMRSFITTVEETERMREIGLDAYRQEARARARQAIHNCKVGTGRA